MEEVLDGFDAVVNLVGLSPLKEPYGVSYEEIHVDGARNVVEACEGNGIGRLVHMSALGADSNSAMAFLRTKGEGEELVLESGLDVTVFKPSTIFDDMNELVRMAYRYSVTRIFPYIRTDLQPVYRRDVVELFQLAVEGETEEDVLEVGGPEEMTLFQFVRRIYNANGRKCYPLPIQPLMVLGLYLMEPLPLVPYGADQARFLGFDNTVTTNHAENYIELTSVDDWLRSQG
jgi:NADH dehydrogenase